MRQNVLCFANLAEICPEDLAHFKGMSPADVHHVILRAMEIDAQAQLMVQRWELLTHRDQLPDLGQGLFLGAVMPDKVVEQAQGWTLAARRGAADALRTMESWAPTNSALSWALEDDTDERILRLDHISAHGRAGSFELKLAAAALDNDFIPAQGRAVAGFGDHFFSTLLFKDEVAEIRAHPEQYALVPLVMADF